MILSELGDIPIQVQKSQRRKTAEIEVNRGTVRVLIPDNLPDERLHDLLSKRISWIKDKIRKQAEVQVPAPKEYVSGESFTYLGRNYRLKVVQSKEENVRLLAGRFVVETPDLSDHGKIHDQLQLWYWRHATKRMTEKVLRFSKSLGVEPRSIAIKDYQARWGSCTSQGDIFFNWKIIIAPHRIVDYVVVHELSHLVRHDHSPEFWRSVKRLVPDYQSEKQWLKDYGHLLNI